MIQITNAHTVEIMGLKFSLLDYQGCLELFAQWIMDNQAHQVCIANVHTTVTCLTDAELRNINNQSLITRDGMPLSWYANLVHDAGLKDRVCGPELMLRCLDAGRDKGWKHFFLGGEETVLLDLVAKMQDRFPGVELVGWHSPPFRALSEAEDQELVDLINHHQPDFLWVGLGAPKQEKWIAAHLSKVHVPVQLGVGAAFDFHSGHVARAPDWMQKIGMEWFYRMMQDRRLIKRYLATNPVFFGYLVRDYVLSRFKKWFNAN
jgi:N-acetylglucosaminyldiphosphoundecaprenol N-acetyl-beta-D-mannosaminyltransferase